MRKIENYITLRTLLQTLRLARLACLGGKLGLNSLKWQPFNLPVEVCTAASIRLPNFHEIDASKGDVKIPDEDQ